MWSNDGGRWVLALSDRDAFSLVLLLLRLEGEFDEELLQLLVTVVDTELLKAATHNKKLNGRSKGTRHAVMNMLVIFLPIHRILLKS